MTMQEKKPFKEGERFGKLVVLRRCENRTVGKKNTQAIQYEFQCDCGNTVKILKNAVKSGRSKSCGCMVAIRASETSRTHGMSRTRTFSIWQGMLSRCHTPTSTRYKYYGGRGITVCESWFSFENFLKDMGEAPEGLSIDRVNNDEGYNKDNCIWATEWEQSINKGTNSNNTSGVRGVTWLKREGKWHAQIGVNYKNIHCGSFLTLEEAAEARRQAEIKYFGKPFQYGEIKEVKE